MIINGKRKKARNVSIKLNFLKTVSAFYCRYKLSTRFLSISTSIICFTGSTQDDPPDYLTAAVAVVEAVVVAYPLVEDTVHIEEGIVAFVLVAAALAHSEEVFVVAPPAYYSFRTGFELAAPAYLVEHLAQDRHVDEGPNIPAGACSLGTFHPEALHPAEALHPEVLLPCPVLACSLEVLRRPAGHVAVEEGIDLFVVVEGNIAQEAHVVVACLVVEALYHQMKTRKC